MLNNLGKPWNIVNICCYIIWWPPSEFNIISNLPTFKWPIVNSWLFKKLLKLNSIYMKKLLCFLWTMREVCIQTLQHMFNLHADILEIVRILKLVYWFIQCTTIMIQGAMFFSFNLSVTPIWMPWNTFTPLLRARLYCSNQNHISIKSR